MLLMIDNYDSFTYNVVQYLAELGAQPEIPVRHGHGRLEHGQARLVKAQRSSLDDRRHRGDHLVVDANPLENLKVLYGTGAVRLNDQTNRIDRVGGIKWTIKDGIVYDAKKMLADVAAMVEKQKRERRGPS